MRNIIWIVLFLLAAGCLEDKSNFDYTEINGLQSVDGEEFQNIESEYTCYQGETLEITPEVKFTIDSIQPDLSYEWYIDGQLTSREHTLVFQSDLSGVYKITFSVVDNKSGMKFFCSSSVTVLSQWAKCWLVLSENPAGESQLSAVLMKIVKTKAVDDRGEEILKDTIIYTGEMINMVPGLGRGPVKLVEHFSVAEFELLPGQIEDEVLVIQQHKTVALNGETLKPEAYSENEFIGEVPESFFPADAVLSYSCKALLDHSGVIYLTPNYVPTEFHAGFYPSEPLFEGEKFSAVIPTNKVATYSAKYFLAISTDANSFVGIIDDGTPSQDDDQIVISQYNSIGARAEIAENSSYDMTLFNNLTREVIYTMWEDSGFDSYPEFVSILKEEGSYYTHHFKLRFAKTDEGDPVLNIQGSWLQPVQAGMFTDFVEAVVFPHKDYLVIANGNDLYRCTYKEEVESVDHGTKFHSFDNRIVAIGYKDINSTEYGGGHLGVALENGDFYILEIIVDEDTGVTTTRELYHHAGFGKVKDVIYKFSSLYNLSSGGIN